MKPTYNNVIMRLRRKYNFPYFENTSSHAGRAAAIREWQNKPNKSSRRKNRSGISDSSWKEKKSFQQEETAVKEELNTLAPQPQVEIYSTYSSDSIPIWQDDRPYMNTISPYNFQATMNPLCEILPFNNVSMASSTMNVHPIPGMTVASGMDFIPNVSSTQMNPFDCVSLREMSTYNITGVVNSEQEKGAYHFTRSVLYPSNPNLPLPTRQQKPDGCKTVIVGGLPVYASEEVVREIFEERGEISIIRMSGNGICHLRFANEASIDSAMHLSGYWIKVDNKDDHEFKGRLFVDYADARDERALEIQERVVEREARRRSQAEQESLRISTPPSKVHYSIQEAHLLNEKLKDEDTFQLAAHTLITWLERGECNKKNANSFYSLIQCTSNRVSKLLSEKKILEAGAQESKMKLNNHMRNILVTFNDIQKVFNAANLQKVRDHFSKPQRKQLDIHREVIDKSKKAHLEEVLTDRIEVEMDCSDDDSDGDSAVTDTVVKNSSQLDVQLLESENKSLRSQLEASQNEVALLRLEGKKERETLENTIHALKQAFQGMANNVMVQNFAKGC